MTENSAATEDTFSPNVSTTRNDELHHYELHVGGQLAVQIRFIDEPGHVDFIHTDTEEKFQGQGLAKVLAHFAFGRRGGIRQADHSQLPLYVPVPAQARRVQPIHRLARAAPGRRLTPRTGRTLDGVLLVTGGTTP